MDRSADNIDFKKLFEEGEERMADLKLAVCDSDKKVSVNAQVIIQYLADTNGLDAIEECRKQRQEFWSPKGIQVFPNVTIESRFLAGNEKDLARLVSQNAYFLHPTTPKEMIVSELVSYNKAKDKALIEVVVNCVPLCGEGWFVSIKNENGKWRFISVNRIWQS